MGGLRVGGGGAGGWGVELEPSRVLGAPLLSHLRKPATPSLTCSQDGVFSAAYSGRRTGYSPAQFLHTWWMLAGARLRMLGQAGAGSHAVEEWLPAGGGRSASCAPVPPPVLTVVCHVPRCAGPAGGHMAGYQQQDAHEFFCFVLEMMAATAGGAGAGRGREGRAHVVWAADSGTQKGWSAGSLARPPTSQPAQRPWPPKPATALPPMPPPLPTRLARHHHQPRVWRHAALRPHVRVLRPRQHQPRALLPPLPRHPAAPGGALAARWAARLLPGLPRACAGSEPLTAAAGTTALLWGRRRSAHAAHTSRPHFSPRSACS